MFPAKASSVKRESLPSWVGTVPATPFSSSTSLSSDASSPTSPGTVPDSAFPRMTSEATAPPSSHPTPYHSHTGAGPSQPDRSAQPAPPVATYSARSASTSRVRLPRWRPRHRAPAARLAQEQRAASRSQLVCRQPRCAEPQAALALGAAHAAEAAHQAQRAATQRSQLVRDPDCLRWPRGSVPQMGKRSPRRPLGAPFGAATYSKSALTGLWSDVTTFLSLA